MATEITLTPPERLFRQCLLDCRDEMQHVPGMKDLVLRWTGGWVRDKLLGTSSHDIDVALSTMTGMQFGQALKDYMQTNGRRYEVEAETAGFKAEIKNLHKIAANPEKSKHLETITTRMFGIDIDFVNLRKEVYDESSRNPQMEFGTPEEDASRRDATVNALFYNLDDKLVEDFTKKGLEDMQKRIIRTPLAPYQTFRDDPLRVLRLIRFASRLDYDIEEEALKAMQDTRIHEALRAKISRERVGVEIEKIVKGHDPYRGLMLIYDLDLYQVVFANPVGNHFPDVSKQPRVYTSLKGLLSENSTICAGLRAMEDQGLMWTLAAYVPWQESETEAVLAAREAIKAPNVVTKILSESIRHRNQLRQVVHDVYDGKATRGQVGMTLRGAGLSWRAQVMHSILCDVALGDSEDTLKLYATFLNWLDEEDLTDAASMKPILNGNQIKQTLEMSRVGPWLKDAIDKVTQWQFDNPRATVEDAKEFVKGKKEEIV